MKKIKSLIIILCTASAMYVIYYNMNLAYHPKKCAPSLWYNNSCSQLNAIIISPLYDYGEGLITINKSFVIQDKNKLELFCQQMHKQENRPIEAPSKRHNLKIFKVLYKFNDQNRIAFRVGFEATYEKDFGVADFFALAEPIDNLYIQNLAYNPSANLYNIISKEFFANKISWVSADIYKTSIQPIGGSYPDWGRY